MRTALSALHTSQALPSHPCFHYGPCFLPPASVTARRSTFTRTYAETSRGAESHANRGPRTADDRPRLKAAVAAALQPATGSRPPLSSWLRLIPALVVTGLAGMPWSSLAAVPSLAECDSQSNPAYTMVTCARYGLDKDNSPKQAWLALICVVEGLETEGVKITEIDSSRYYLHAEAPSKVPPQGVDDLEFLLLPEEEMVLYRSASRQALFVYPLQQPVSDGGTIKKRLNTIQLALGWTTLGYGDRIE